MHQQHVHHRRFVDYDQVTVQWILYVTPKSTSLGVDLEQTVRDAVVLALPLAPLCTDDCPGLCPECGGRRADLGPDHGHDTLDPRWAALRERASADGRTTN